MTQENKLSEYKKYRSDHIADWMTREWMPRYPALDLRVVWASNECVDANVLGKLDKTLPFDGYTYSSYEQIDVPVVSYIEELDKEGSVTDQIGAFIIHFNAVAGEQVADILIISTHYSEDGSYTTALAAVPIFFRKAWAAFTEECDRIAYSDGPMDRVHIIGGLQDSFVPTVTWDEIVLPDELKAEIIDDVRSFFTKGVEVYLRLNLKPFRKLLMAGVPGTGKTMLCNALAKWALEQGYMVIYVSSAKKSFGDQYGSNFNKIQEAVEIAARSDFPTLMLIEELDAYLHADEKALILNVLDGSESTMNEQGTMLIATTNYPEAIDERVLKRPGRLDRIFIVPEVKSETEAEAMLRRYLGPMWQDEHRRIVPKLVGYPGAFIREVSIYALTQVAYDDLPELPLAILEQSLQRLKKQIDQRDDFLKAHAPLGFGRSNNGRGS